MNESITAMANLVEEVGIVELQQMMTSGRLTSRDLVKAYMARIALYDRGGPVLNSVLELNPEALFIADALDLERSREGARGPLHGVPILVKDNIDTGDMMHTSAGSLALANSYAREDSFVAKKLREAGAVILGKANMTEWANMMTDDMPAGYSSRGGQVKNPYGSHIYEAGGSSSGSAVSVAASLVAASIGTETSGSILNPAFRDSIVGIKPTVGLVSRTGVIPISHIQDTPGPLGRTVEDAVIVLGAIVGVDEHDAATHSSQGRTYTDYTRFLDKEGLRGARIGIARAFVERAEEEHRSVFAVAETVVRDAGACVVDVDMPYPESRKSRSLVYEFKPAINNYLARLSSEVPVHSLGELIKFNENDPDKMLRYGQSVLIRSEETSGNLTEAEYILDRVRDEKESRKEGIDRALRQSNVEALLFPTWMNAGISARAGYPSICVPAGYTDAGWPVGVTFAGGAWSEPALIRFAYAFEQAAKARKAPTF